MNFRTKFAAGAVFAALALGLIPIPGPTVMPAAQAQNLGLRVVDGTVQDDTETPVVGATVFLRNTKSKSIRSYTSTDGGKFRFAQVNMSEDFDLWAEKDGRKSPNKTISSWDTRKSLSIDLKLK